MLSRLVVLGLALACLLPVGWTAAAQPTVIKEGALTVCLPRNGGVIAGRRLTGGSGFDFRVSKQIAAELGLSLEVLWIENDLDEESDPVRETYALLANGLCDAVPGHPRYESAVGKPDFDRASLPRWLGMPQEIDPDTGLLKDTLAGFVNVKPISVTQGYMRSQIGLVYRDGSSEPNGFDALGTRKLALQQGTLSGAIATLQVAPAEHRNLVMLKPGAGFLWRVETKEIDLAIVDVAAFDAHRKANPFTPLRLANWRHKVGMDIGIAVLTENEPLRAALEKAVSKLLANGVLPSVGEEEGLTYAAPQSEELTPKFTLQSLRFAQ
ncbi:MAG: transporter substrate-binding domain-containing protein [Pseudomonadota bacterium]